MVRLLPVLVATGAVLGLIDVSNAQYYASKYDHIDVDTILNNRRMVNYYAACLLSQGPCPPEGLEFKRILPEALRTNCLRCTEKQKTVALRAIRRLKKEYPKVWAQLEKQWDADGIYITKFESTFGAKPYLSSPQTSFLIQNRFGSENENKSGENTISQTFSNPTTASTSTTTSKATSTVASTTTSKTTTSTSRPTSTVKAASTQSTVSTKASVTKTTHRVNTIHKQIINTISASTKPTRRPRPNFGQRVQATVSLGTNIVGDLVRGLGAIGNRVVETGAEIAGVVLKNIARPL